MLTERESDVVGAALRACVEGPFISDFEFHALTGVDRVEMRAVLDVWPEVIHGETAFLAVNGAFVVLLDFPHDHWETWRQYGDADRTELVDVFIKWRAEAGEPLPPDAAQRMS